MKPTDDPSLVTRVEHETWQRCADQYVDGFGALVGGSIESLLDAAAVGPATRVLDIGTGPGITAAAAHARAASPIGIDFSEAMLAEAKRRNPDVEFRHANAEDLPFDDGHFDAVVANFVLHHLANPHKVLSEAHRVLKSGGQVAFTVWDDRDKLEGFGLFLSAFIDHTDVVLPHGPLFGVSEPATFHEMMKTAGFKNSNVTNVPIEWQIASIDTYLSTFSAWAGLDALPEATQSAIESTVRTTAAQLVSQGKLALPNPAILVSARK